MFTVDNIFEFIISSK